MLRRLAIYMLMVGLAAMCSSAALGQGFTPASPTDGTTLPNADPANALFQWTATGGASHPYIEFSWDSRFRCRCSDCFFQYWAPDNSTQATIPIQWWGQVVRLARLNDNTVYWRMASSTHRYRRTRNGRRRWVFGEWSYSSSLSLIIPDAVLTRGAIEHQAASWKLNFTASGVADTRVWVSDDNTFPLGRRTNTYILAPNAGESFVIIAGRLLARLQALAQGGNLFWRVNGNEMGLGTAMQTTVGNLWTQDVVADAGADRNGAGFGQAVSLDGTGSMASSGGDPLAYAWTQTGGGQTVTLTDANTATPDFTTPTAQDVLDVNDQPRHGIVDVSRYDNFLEFKLTVTDQNGRSANDTVEIQLVSPSSGMPNVPLNQPVYLNAPNQGSYNWSLTGTPGGSGAALDSGTVRNPMFTPDVAGTYSLSENGSGAVVTMTVNAATFVGVDANCTFCHQGGLTGVADNYTPWSQTDHASFFENALNGQVSPYYRSSCVECHTLGYDPHHSNGGFDDVATQLGWTFPASLGAGVYDAQPAAIKNLSNIQCENCHGPGSGHFGRHDDEEISISFNVGVCAVCHDDGHYHTRPTQWRSSGHSNPPVRTGPGCGDCHTAQGGALRMAGQAMAVEPDSPEPQTCAACHDPHDDTNSHQLRTVGNVTLANGTVVSGGVWSVCMTCHQARRDTTDVATFNDKRAPHHSPQTDVYMGSVAYEFGLGPYTSSAHKFIVSQQCVSCHMAASPGSGQPGHHEVGDHSFNMTHNAVENIASCNVSGCHSATPLTSFNRTARGDYDADGTIEGVTDEVNGLITLLKDAINAELGDGVTPGSYSSSRGRIVFLDHTGANVTATVTENLFGAAYNQMLIEWAGGHGVHNTGYSVQVLQRSYKIVTGNAVPNADIR